MSVLTLVLLLLIALILPFSSALAQPHFKSLDVDPAHHLRILCYHDVRDNLRATLYDWPEATAIDTTDLVRHFNWLKDHGFEPVSMQQVIDARNGRAVLPEKPVLLTFDDGYKSTYTHVFPLLKQFNYPAVIALVGEWMEVAPGGEVAYGDEYKPREAFMSWEEVREMHASGFVEVASHSYGLHRGVIGNPQGNSMPAAVTRKYRGEDWGYETDEEYALRIRSDLARSAQVIKREIGVAPRVMVWPYGAYNLDAAQWAGEAGMPITFTLDTGANSNEVPLAQLRRSLVMYNHGVADLAFLLSKAPTVEGIAEPRKRIIHVDLDYVYDPDEAQQNKNLSKLIDRIAHLRPSTVYLQAFADPDGDGVADALYFENRHLPMRADLFSRVSWQLRTRAHVQVYAWMPLLAFQLPENHPVAKHIVQVEPTAPPAASEGRYWRLSPFSAAARQVIREIYEDLGKRVALTGVLFHDDATLSDFEDASPMALQHYAREWGLPAISEIRANEKLRAQWARVKTDHLIAFSLELAETLRRYHPHLETARNMYAQPVLQPESEEWFAQDLPSFLAAYDYTAVMAMPYMEQAAQPEAWLKKMISMVKAEKQGLRKTVFELQAKDWRDGTPVPTETLVAHWRTLHLEGARHWGYYPDDFHNDQPRAKGIRTAISLETAPARP